EIPDHPPSVPSTGHSPLLPATGRPRDALRAGSAHQSAGLPRLAAHATRCAPALLTSREGRAGGSGLGGDEGAGGDGGPRAHPDVLAAVDLVAARAPDLAHRLGDPVHPVDVALAQLAAVGVDGQPAADLDVPVLDEVLGLAPGAEPELLELGEHQRREV